MFLMIMNSLQRYLWAGLLDQAIAIAQETVRSILQQRFKKIWFNLLRRWMQLITTTIIQFNKKTTQLFK